MVSLPRLNREPNRLTTQAKRRKISAPVLPRAFVPGERSTFRWWWRILATGSTTGHTAVCLCAGLKPGHRLKRVYSLVPKSYSSLARYDA